MRKSLIAATLPLLLVVTVVLNGVHAKDILSLHGITDSHNSGTKITADYHPHVDKQVHKMTSDTPQLDSRSLRLRDPKRLQLSTFKKWLDTWRNQLLLG